MKRLPFWLMFVFVMAGSAGLAPAAWAADGSCNFRAKGLSPLAITLNPRLTNEVRVPITVGTTFADKAGDCGPTSSTMRIEVQGGNTRQLVSGAQTISYAIQGLPITLNRPGNAPPGNPGSGYVTWFTPGQIEVVIQWSAFADKPALTYSDTFTVVLTP